MQLSVMRDRVRQVLRDDAKAFVTDANITDWLNEAQLDIVSRLKLLQKETVANFPDGTGTLALPTDFLEIVRFTAAFTSGYNDVAWVDDQTFQSWVESTGTPSKRIGRIFNQKIELYPAPSSGSSYTHRYFREPVTLVNDTDVPEVNDDHHPRMVNYGRAQGKYMLGEEADGDRYFSMFQQGLPATYVQKEQQYPGPMTIVMDPGPFDSDPDAAHI